MEALARHNLAVGGKNDKDELLTNALHIEETIFQAAADQEASLRVRTWSLNMLESLETKRQQQRSTVKSVEKCIGALEKMRSRKFNDEQCDYLVDKLKVVTQRANVYLDRIHAKAYRSNSDVNFPSESSLKCLPALTIQITSFVERCCKDAWLPVAVTLTNTAEYVSSIGFDLELCRVDFCREGGSLTPDQVLDINKAEFEIVRKKAASDMETLLARVRSGLPSFRGGKKDLANYLLQRLSRIQANGGSFTSGSSFWGANHEQSLWTRLFKSVKSIGPQIGKGSAATVHKATWLGIQVAKKTFEGHENSNFMQEVGILGKLCHPNITSMFSCAKDSSSAKRWCAIIMELMDKDLHDLMRQRCSNSAWPFSILEGVDIMHQIGEGVKYLHAQKIVHRDLKSFNILVKVVKDKGSKTEHVHAKVADFGLSKTKESSIRYSNQTCNTGTNRWMAPESINLNAGEQGSTSTKPTYPFKCDVYSFAMVCYEILTGCEPFYEESSPAEIKKKVLKGERPILPDHCPPMLKALIERCWTQQPEERPSFAVICSELKYLKYLLITGTNASSSTSILTQHLDNTACSTGLAAATSSQVGFVNDNKLLEVEEVPHASKQGTELTAESTPTATMMPKVKGAEDQSVHQDDPFTFQDVATILLENHDETVVLSGSGISSQNESEGGGDQGKGGINSGGTVSPPTRSTSNRCREPSILYKSQPTKRFRLG